MKGGGLYTNGLVSGYIFAKAKSRRELLWVNGKNVRRRTFNCLLVPYNLRFTREDEKEFNLSRLTASS